VYVGGVLDHYVAQVVQAQDYYAFGAAMEGRSFSISSYRFGFNGKENDPEFNGNYDFGARFLDVRLGRWLSTDPVTHSSQSPYTGFDNNPIFYIDPLGTTTDDYKVDQEGNISLIKETDDKTDKIFATDKEGNVVENTFIEVEKSVLESKESYTRQDKNVTYDVYQLRGDDSSKELFEFLADNTQVEWSLALTGEAGEDSENFMTTSHNSGTEQGFSYAYSKKIRGKYTIREHIHNHPNSMGIPSGVDIETTGVSGDIQFSTVLRDDQRNLNVENKITFKIYVPDEQKYIEYGPESTGWDFDDYLELHKIPTIEIKGND
jgi:RHS repeat-associated protein